MPTCSSCKHWRPEEMWVPRYDRTKPSPTVAMRGQEEGWGLCERIPFFRDTDDSEALAAAQDDDGQNAVLYTSPKFHCAHWTTKEE